MRRRPAAVGLALVAATLVCAGCSISTDASAHAVQGDPLYVVPTTSTTPTSTAATASTTFSIYFVKDNVLVPVKRLLSKPTAGTESLNDALDQLAVGPSAAENRNEITTDFSRVESGAPHVTSYDPADGLAVVALDTSFEYLSGAALAYALGQIVYTITAVSGTKVTKVSFTLGGGPFPGYSPSGATLTGPVTRGDYRAIYAGARPAS